MTIYIVEDDFGRIGRAYRETDVEKADLETTIQNLITGQFNDPIRVVSFNTAERWSADVSEDIAREIQRRHEIIGEPVPAHLLEFVDSYTGRTRQFALMSWTMRLIRPVGPPKGKPIVTLSDARTCALALPKSQQATAHVQAGIAALLHAAHGEVCEFVAQVAVAHIVHGPPNSLNRGKRDRPWLRRKPPL